MAVSWAPRRLFALSSDDSMKLDIENFYEIYYEFINHLIISFRAMLNRFRVPIENSKFTNHKSQDPNHPNHNIFFPLSDTHTHTHIHTHTHTHHGYVISLHGALSARVALSPLCLCRFRPRPVASHQAVACDGSLPWFHHGLCSAPGALFKAPVRYAQINWVVRFFFSFFQRHFVRCTFAERPVAPVHHGVCSVFLLRALFPCPSSRY